MSTRRMKRLNAQLQREIAELLRRQVRDPRVTAVTVTRVEVTPDLSVARVFVRTLNGREGTAEALRGLDAANAFLRRALSGTLTLRRVPELTFMEDASLEQAMRIEELLLEVRPEGGWDAVEDEGVEEGAEDGAADGEPAEAEPRGGEPAAGSTDDPDHSEDPPRG